MQARDGQADIQRETGNGSMDVAASNFFYFLSRPGHIAQTSALSGLSSASPESPGIRQ
jgi:hypothetical protein